VIRNVRPLVYAVALVLTLLPTMAAFYAVNTIVGSAVPLAFNFRISNELKASGDRLKQLAKSDPAKEGQYRREFSELQEVREAYDTLLGSGNHLQNAYLQVFFLISGLALVLGLLLAWWLNRRIIRSHDDAVLEMQRARERALFLEQSESWRLFAQKLVHEIKNPLTPVQMMVGRIPAKYEAIHPASNAEFRAILQETKAIVNEEIAKVNTWVEAFSHYARMPAPKKEPVELYALVTEFARQYQEQWPRLAIRVEGDPRLPALSADRALLKQVLFNLAKNSAEATADRANSLTLKIGLNENGDQTILAADAGPGIPAALTDKLFRPYASGKEDLGRGLGLAISKKILLEHGGDLEWIPAASGASFRLTIPTSPEAAKS
jgi:signal transduction histidine kinase